MRVRWKEGRMGKGMKREGNKQKETFRHFYYFIFHLIKGPTANSFFFRSMGREGGSGRHETAAHSSFILSFTPTATATWRQCLFDVNCNTLSFFNNSPTTSFSLYLTLTCNAGVEAEHFFLYFDRRPQGGGPNRDHYRSGSSSQT